MKKNLYDNTMANGELIFIKGFGEGYEELDAKLKELFTVRMHEFGGLSEGFSIEREYKDGRVVGIEKKRHQSLLEVVFDEFQDKSTIAILNEFADAMVATATVHPGDNCDTLVIRGPILLVAETNKDRTDVYETWVFRHAHFSEVGTGEAGFYREKPGEGDPSNKGGVRYNVHFNAVVVHDPAVTEFARALFTEVKKFEEATGMEWDNSFDQLRTPRKDGVPEHPANLPVVPESLK